MTAKKKGENYQVYGRVNGVFSAYVSAGSLADAQSAAEKLSIDDFIEWREDYIDGSFEVVGVQKADWGID
jgi:hypothetical protein